MKYLVEFDFKYDIYLARELPHDSNVGVRAWYCIIEADSFLSMIQKLQENLDSIKNQMSELRKEEDLKIG